MRILPICFSTFSREVGREKYEMKVSLHQEQIYSERVAKREVKLTQQNKKKMNVSSSERKTMQRKNDAARGINSSTFAYISISIYIYIQMQIEMQIYSVSVCAACVSARDCNMLSLHPLPYIFDEAYRICQLMD